MTTKKVKTNDIETARNMLQAVLDDLRAKVEIEADKVRILEDTLYALEDWDEYV